MAVAESVEQQADSFIHSPHKLLIDGEWVEAASGKTFETLNPATEEVLAEVAYGQAEDVNRAVKAARKAFDDDSPWRRMNASDRGRLIWKIVVLKPAEQTPLSALRLGELLQEAGLPDGVVNIITGFGDAGAALAEHDDVDKVAFTGSTEVGKLIVKAAAGNLKKVSLELGGKSPNVVFADADMESAVAGAANAIFFNHGQCCNAGSRLYVQKGAFDDVVAGVAEAAKNIKVAPGTDPESQMGPLISDEQFQKVLGYLDSGQSAGAEAVVGGGKAADRGYFVHRTAKRLRAGTVWINTYHVFDAAMPFGGYKESGWGREMGSQVLNNYLETKSVVTAL